MPTLTNSSTFSIGAGSTAVEEVTLTVIPAASAPVGKGRLEHPTLGVLDYTYNPNAWTNIDGEVLAPPTWATSKTLSGSSNTLWRGDIRDVVCTERWTKEAGGIVMPMGMLRTLLLFYLNPPDPASAWVVWRPRYTTEQAYRVLLTSLQVGGDGITLTPIATNKDWVVDEVSLSLKIVSAQI